MDLVAAVLRQVPFTDTLSDLGWLDPGFFGTDEYQRISHHCILRYRRCEGPLTLPSYWMLTVHQLFIPDSFSSLFTPRPEHGHRLRLAVCQNSDFPHHPPLTADFRSTHLLSPANYIFHCREAIGKFVNQ